MDAPVTASHRLRIACSQCSLRELCLPIGLSGSELDQLDTLISTRRRLAPGQTLFRAGSAFDALYAVRRGFLKSTILSSDGREQVTGFHMPGEIVGLDGIDGGVHRTDATALEDTEACEIAYDDFASVAERFPQLQSNLSRLMSREVARDHQVMLLLGSFNAEERIASFLLNLSQRYVMRGYSARRFLLRMTRAEIGSYVGMKIETVSRTLSRLQARGLLRIEQKAVEIVDLDALEHLAKSSSPHCG